MSLPGLNFQLGDNRLGGKQHRPADGDGQATEVDGAGDGGWGGGAGAHDQIVMAKAEHG